MHSAPTCRKELVLLVNNAINFINPQQLTYPSYSYNLGSDLSASLSSLAFVVSRYLLSNVDQLVIIVCPRDSAAFILRYSRSYLVCLSAGARHDWVWKALIGTVPVMHAAPSTDYLVLVVLLGMCKFNLKRELFCRVSCLWVCWRFTSQRRPSKQFKEESLNL